MIGYIFLSVFAISAASLAGVFALSTNKERLYKAVYLLVALAVGALLGDVFIHLLPEIYSEADTESLVVPIMIALGFFAFFILEKFLRWHHAHGLETEESHNHKGDIKHIGNLNLIADSFHNFIDGILIATSYMVSTELGVATTVAVLLHEIPQEIGDFGLLIHAGFSRARALLYNFFSALAAVLGAVIALLIGSGAEEFAHMSLPIAAGALIYIAASDLVPELHKTSDFKKSFIQFGGVMLGFILMVLLVFVEVGH